MGLPGSCDRYEVEKILLRDEVAVVLEKDEKVQCVLVELLKIKV